MWSTSREIAEGDVVIIWLTREAVQPLTIASGKEFNGRFGCYKHSDLIGVPYGSKVASRNGKGFIHVLRPTPELWTLALPHRTQILYLVDIAFITTWLGIRPGSRVVEAGTGSGSFTHSVARTIGPEGRLFSFEFHQSRVAKAREEFTQHGMSDYVLLQHRNVCKDGFGLHGEVDSVFLDLPAPWDAIPHAKEAARKDRTARICCFSPCIEQVLRTVSTLNEHGFTDITMYETLLRPHEVGQPPAPIPISIIRHKLQAAELRKEERRLKQIAASRARKEDGERVTGGSSSVEQEQSAHKRKRSVAEDNGTEDEGKSDNGANQAKITTIVRNVTVLGEDEPQGSARPIPPRADATCKGKDVLTESLSPHISSTLTVTQPIKEVRGHTSYLTFACLLPTIIPPCHIIHTASPEIDAVPEPEQPSQGSESPQPMDAQAGVKDLPPGYHDILNANQMVDVAKARAVAEGSDKNPAG